MRYFLPEDLTNIDNKIFKGNGGETIQVMTRTYWSFGELGRAKKNDSKYTGWGGSYQKILMCKQGQHATKYVRCVKDLELFWDLQKYLLPLQSLSGG